MDTPLTQASQEKIKQKSRRHSDLQTRQLHIKKWQESRLSMSAYCRQQNLSVSSLSKWIQDNAKKLKTSFKPIISTAAHSLPKTPADNVIEILTSQQIKIRFINTSDASLILAVIKGLIRCN